MSITRILSLTVILSISPFSSLEGTKASEPVAIVYSLTGKASLTAPVHRPLRLFDRLPAGRVLEISADSRLALAFLNGLRYELGGRSRVTLGKEDFVSRTGPVRSLPRLPPLPLPSPIEADDRPGPRAGAVRIRAERIVGLYPRRGAAVPAGEANLVFEPLENSGRYRVEVQDEQGQVVFRADVEAPSVRVSSRALLPGTGYHWTVRTLDRPGPIAQGEADFVTLPEHAARMREELRSAIAVQENRECLVLLAGIDRSLGMLIEARQELQAALERSPGDASLTQELAALERQLQEGGDEPQP